MRVWDEDLVTDLFEERDVDSIYDIPLSKMRHCDGRFWLYYKGRKYSVSSAYESLTQLVDGGSIV